MITKEQIREEIRTSIKTGKPTEALPFINFQKIYDLYENKNFALAVLWHYDQPIPKLQYDLKPELAVAQIIMLLDMTDDNCYIPGFPIYEVNLLLDKTFSALPEKYKSVLAYYLEEEEPYLNVEYFTTHRHINLEDYYNPQGLYNTTKFLELIRKEIEKFISETIDKGDDK